MLYISWCCMYGFIVHNIIVVRNYILWSLYQSTSKVFFSQMTLYVYLVLFNVLC